MKEHSFSEDIKKIFRDGVFANNEYVSYIFRCTDCNLLFFKGHDGTTLTCTDKGEEMYDCEFNCDLAVMKQVMV